MRQWELTKPVRRSLFCEVRQSKENSDFFHISAFMYGYEHTGAGKVAMSNARIKHYTGQL